ncbi:MAG: 2-oxo acid dehydrogenase subunit E2 [Cyclobacteriaceae bacterium]|nr:2-oxo acid dehydrogenase subunit E2 [Cyclobacteriaceae bacterium]
MALKEVFLPKMGESVFEATIISWLKKEGESIDPYESLVEVATDKVDTEVPSNYGGILKKRLAREGDVVAIGKAIALIETPEEEDNTDDIPTPSQDREPLTAGAKTSNGNGNSNGGAIPLKARSQSGRFYSPLVRKIAQDEKVKLQELESIEGTGKGGRVTKNDILNYIKTRPKSSVEPDVMLQKAHAISEVTGDDEIIEMDRMRKIIAQRMVESVHIAPHVQSFVEADMTHIVKWREKMKEVVKRELNQNLTYTPVIIEAIVMALREFPALNASVDGEKIIIRRRINIGMAVALPDGNLIVPVIRDADRLSLLGLTQRVNELAERARKGKLSADDLSGGTYTVTNVGSFGSLLGTPIILQPQVAIMATGTIVKKPAVLETAEGDVIAIRHKMFLSHSFDHRIIDGAMGSLFAKRVAEILEKFNPNRSL